MLFFSLCIDDIKSDHFRFNGACREGIFSLHSFHVKQLQCMIIDYLKRAYLSAWTMPLNGFSISHPLQNSFTPKPLKRYSSLLWFCELIITPFFSLYLPRHDICFLSQLTQPWYDSVIANLSSLKIQHNPDLVLVCGPLYPQRIQQNYFIRKHECQSWKSIIFTST